MITPSNESHNAQMKITKQSLELVGFYGLCGL